MSNVQVTFTGQKTGSLEVLVIIRQVGTTNEFQLHFQNPTETQSLATGATYVVLADLIGDVGDAFSLAWSANGNGETLLNKFKLDPNHARRWPGGKWWDRAVTGFQL